MGVFRTKVRTRPPISGTFSDVRGCSFFPLVPVDAHRSRMHPCPVSKPKKAKPSDATATPGTVMAAKIRARANKLTDSEREALMGDAMRIIYGSQGDAVRAHRR
jgi:hypothetical protein